MKLSMNYGEIREAAMLVSPSGSARLRERPGMGLYARLHETLDSLDSRPLFDIPAAVAALAVFRLPMIRR